MGEVSGRKWNLGGGGGGDEQTEYGVQVQCQVCMSSSEGKMNRMIGQCGILDPGGSTTAQAGHSG